LNLIDFDFYRDIAEKGVPERNLWRFAWGARERFDPVWNMVLEGSTGFSGSFARQVTLTRATALLPETRSLLNALEQSASEEAIVLQGDGSLLSGHAAAQVGFRYYKNSHGGKYRSNQGKAMRCSTGELLKMAAEGRLVCTLTGKVGPNVDFNHPQPALWTEGPIQVQRGHEHFPILYPGSLPLRLSGRHIDPNAFVIVDGRRQAGSITAAGEVVTVQLAALPGKGLHFLQVQNPAGLVSNEFLFTVTENAKGQAELFTNAAMRGNTELIKNMLQHGMDINAVNTDGNSALLIASFFCREEAVKLLLANGATLVKNKKGESPVDVVSTNWSDSLAGFYSILDSAEGLNLNMPELPARRLQIEKLLSSHSVAIK
jgi:hypothetical protein